MKILKNIQKEVEAFRQTLEQDLQAVSRRDSHHYSIVEVRRVQIIWNYDAQSRGTVSVRCQILVNLRSDQAIDIVSALLKYALNNLDYLPIHVFPVQNVKDAWFNVEFGCFLSDGNSSNKRLFSWEEIAQIIEEKSGKEYAITSINDIPPTLELDGDTWQIIETPNYSSKTAKYERVEAF